MKKVLMCPPDYFAIEYEINPWMHKDNPVNKEKAQKEWQAVYDAYIQSGIKVELMKPTKGLPDMVFTANGGLVHGNTFICSKHNHPERAGEEKHFQKWFADHGYTVHTLKHHQSGEGDALFFRDTLYLAYGFRSSRASHDEIKNILGVKTVSLKLINPFFYDFDTAFCPVGDKAILYYPEAFDRESRLFLRSIPDAFPIDGSEAKGFLSNSVLVGDTLFVEYLDHQLETLLKGIGVKAREFEMGEFKKSGGGIKCITLYLNH